MYAGRGQGDFRQYEEHQNDIESSGEIPRAAGRQAGRLQCRAFGAEVDFAVVHGVFVGRTMSTLFTCNRSHRIYAR